MISTRQASTASFRVLLAALAAGVLVAACASAPSAPQPRQRTGPVSIGLLWIKNPGNAPGVKNLAPDMHAGEQVLVNDMNAHGGLAGHRIIPVFHAFDPAVADIAAQWQQACVDFTQDHHVFAVVTAGINDPSFAQCLSNAGVIEVSALLSTENQANFAAAPLLVEPVSMNLDRLAAVEPQELVAHGWLANRNDAPAGTSPKPKIGVVVGDTPAFREAFNNFLKPAYARLGAPVTDEAFVSEGAQLSAQLPGIVLRFASDGINHVTFLTASGGPPGLFMNQATRQHYQPRYGLSSQDAMSVVIEDLPDPRGQLHQALSVGWFAEADVANYQSHANSQPGQPKCLALMRAHNITASDGNSAGIDDYMCDSLWYLRAALQQEGGTLTQNAFLTGVDRLGAGYRPATTFGTSLSQARRDGVAQIRIAAFGDACTCFRYITHGLTVRQ